MKVITADTAGFCFGVERAVNTVYDALKEHEGRIYTYGPIIHNESVVQELLDKGVAIISSPDELEQIEEGTIIIRSHGVTKEIYGIIEKTGLKYIDATCPFVLKIHKLVQEAAERDEHVVIAGDHTHPEVEGIISFSGNHVTVLKDEKEAADFVPPEGKKLFLVAQTTFNSNIFNKIVEIFDKKMYYYNTVYTICNATAKRQQEAAELAGRVDAMIVIGGAHSSNTRKLYDIARSSCENTIFVQTLDDLVSRKDAICDPASCVGITAGASTPKNIIEEVQNYVRRFWTNVG
ncbi:MAG: 4-hydroxy-3-methylbut-2-enyl diphosphate reductase [Lachnospiraceae bacterium]|nr:4-hydroxy-3-methylbut-2-enyl diphosphate reductase [Lachnospiraceae bacterium]MBR1523619.1 4-hydroxy-3-methylbut-2-enyl diphosphate reductase [Lachnospiraceae bacterium]